MSTLFVDNLQPHLETKVNVPGHITNVVQGSQGTSISLGSTSWTATGLTASITTQTGNSKVLIVANMVACRKSTDNTLSFRLYRDGSNIVTLNQGLFDTGTSVQHTDSISHMYLDTLNSQGTFDYEIWWKGANTGTINMNVGDWGLSTITLMEIGG